MCNCNENCNDNECTCSNGHSECCRYHDDQAILYARMQIVKDPDPDKFLLISAHEIGVIDDYFEQAKLDDKDVTIDLETADNLSYQLVYGDFMISRNDDVDEIIKFAEAMKKHALINIDVEEFGKLTASVYDDICIYKGEGSYDKSIPFVALMKTVCKEQDDVSTTMFPCCDRAVFLNLVNRDFLLACRKFVQIDGLTLDNWKSFIDKDILKEAYDLATIYTGEVPELTITDEMWDNFKKTIFKDKEKLTKFLGIDTVKVLSKRQTFDLMDRLREKEPEHCVAWYSELIGFDLESE